MGAPACTDAEFVELFKQHRSAVKVAHVLNIAERKVYERRRAIERRLNIALLADAPQAKHYKHLSPHEYPMEMHLGIENGHVIVFSDAHFWPGIRTVAFRGLLLLAKELKPKAMICGGDAFDGARISRFPRPGFLEQGPTVVEELKACKAAMEEIEDATPQRSPKVWTLGNHDNRFEARLAHVAPEYEGMDGFHLKDHFPKWRPAWTCWITDDTIVSHRYRGGIHATHNNTVNSGVNIVTGHLHQLKATPFRDFRGNRYGVDSGTLAEPNGKQFSTYLEGKIPNWRSGFVVLTFKDGRLLLPQIAQRWSDHEIEFNGKIIDVSKE